MSSDVFKEAKRVAKDIKKNGTQPVLQDKQFFNFIFEGYGFGIFRDGKHKHPVLMLIKENGKEKETVAVFTSEYHAAKCNHFLAMFFSDLMEAADYYKAKLDQIYKDREAHRLRREELAKKKWEETHKPKNGEEPEPYQRRKPGRPKGSKDRPKVPASTYNADFSDMEEDESLDSSGL